MRRFIFTMLTLLTLTYLAGCTDGMPAGQTDLSQTPGTVTSDTMDQTQPDVTKADAAVILTPDGTAIPEWNRTDAYVELNNNMPWFDEADKARTDPFENYSDLDNLSRCGEAYANICLDLMPTEKRGEIGSVKPSGWHTVRYNGVVSGNYLYNRCHLIGYQLAGENANEKNLITGTRYLNIEGMLPFENLVNDYVDETGNHVLYRVTPVYAGDELVARGVIMEGYSVEDGGDGIEFNVFAYNVQPGIEINYADGTSRLSGSTGQPATDLPDGQDAVDSYVLNTKSGKFHEPGCTYAESMNESNREIMYESCDGMISDGYVPCGSCRPDIAG